ncbi:hypothetical protein [Virgibacillus sp. Bac332]|uniref:hypothetical protein n=1 Tax=Virgibacillus sp. Bac332 TaxID=2419842 RepID=UPI000EF4AF05|nr:hypothetical protein [Virgibacillus sp. Bac332]
MNKNISINGRKYCLDVDTTCKGTKGKPMVTLSIHLGSSVHEFQQHFKVKNPTDLMCDIVRWAISEDREFFGNKFDDFKKMFEEWDGVIEYE